MNLFWRAVHWLREKEREANLADYLIVLLTAVIAFWAGMTWLEIHGAGKQTDRIISADERMAKAMEDSVGQAKQGLDVSIEASRTDQRAWMDMIINAPPNFQEDRPFTTSAQMKNLGKTPAKRIMLGYIFEGITPSTNPLFDDHRLKFINAGMLPPQGPATLSVEITPGKPDELLGKGRFEAIREGKIVVYYWGLITYDDVFGFHHWLKFCYIYNVAHRRFDLVATHNAIDDETR